MRLITVRAYLQKYTEKSKHVLNNIYITYIYILSAFFSYQIGYFEVRILELMKKKKWRKQNQC